MPPQTGLAHVLNSIQSSPDVQSPPTVLCDYCGQLFDTRKALSCHARAHLRHLGLAWSIRTSPIDLLKEVMIHGVESVKESAVNGSSAKAALSPPSSRKCMDSLHSGEPDTKSCTSPLNYSLKEKSPSVKSGAPHPGETNSNFLFQTFTVCCSYRNLKFNRCTSSLCVSSFQQR